jgi:hypothetical protein
MRQEGRKREKRIMGIKGDRDRSGNNPLYIHYRKWFNGRGIYEDAGRAESQRQ